MLRAGGGLGDSKQVISLDCVSSLRHQCRIDPPPCRVLTNGSRSTSSSTWCPRRWAVNSERISHLTSMDWSSHCPAITSRRQNIRKKPRTFTILLLVPTTCTLPLFPNAVSFFKIGFCNPNRIQFVRRFYFQSTKSIEFTGTTWMQELVWMVANQCDFEQSKSTQLSIRSPFLEWVWTTWVVNIVTSLFKYPILFLFIF